MAEPDAGMAAGGAPQFVHDHDDCVYLGAHRVGHGQVADLYFCEQGGMLATVIARFSSEPSNYTSGMALADFDPYLAEARKRSIARGLFDD